MKREEQQSRQREEGHGVGLSSADPLAFLADGVIDPHTLATAREFAASHDIPVSQVLFSHNIISKETYISELAVFHGLKCLCTPADLEGFELDRAQALSGRDFATNSAKNGLMNLSRDGQQYVAFDVLHYGESTQKLFFSGAFKAKQRLLLMTPEISRILKARHDQNRRLHGAIYGLFEAYKGLSAKDKTTYAQKIVLAFFFGLLAGGLVLSPIGTMYVLGTLLNLLFLYTILLRLFAVITLDPNFEQKQKFQENLPGAVQIELAGREELPVYTILVPLFREHRVVGQLINNLLALDYPRDKLDIKLIFEQGDEATLAAARACSPPDYIEFVIVPSSQPQTKPKALNYALASARGQYVVVYDAEDRPQTDQLRKAVAAFGQAQGEHPAPAHPLACLQAGLNHYNVDENWLARQFTIEYTALFDGLLPALQRLDLPIMLGGTSNHFRLDVLRAIGGWDAFNVTEDADLGIRLMRLGYRCEVLGSTTYEEACCRPRDWVRQRTRWLKGWLQTYLVHMRHPITLFKQLGARGFAGFQLILGAQVLSLIAHPLFIVFMGFEAWNGDLFNYSKGFFSALFWVLALGNFILGYGLAVWLGFATLRRRGLGRLYWQLPFMPLYWLLISFATFRALVHYVVKPFYWEKTEHGLSAQARNKKA